MTKEFHVFTNIQAEHEQAFVFEMERADNKDYITFNELWVVTTHKHGEVRTRLNMNQMVQLMAETVGGNVDDENVPTIMDVFKDILPDEKQLEVHIDLCQKEIVKDTNNSTDQILKAHDYTNELYKNDNGQLKILIDKLVKSKSNNENN